MRQRSAWVLVLGTFLAQHAGAPQAEPTLAEKSQAAVVEGMSSERLQWIDRHLREEVERGHIGSSVGLVARNGQIVFHKAYGEADPDVPMFKDAIVRLASVGKGFTAVAALILYERGQLSLNDSVSRYIPEFADIRVKAGDGSTEDPKRAIRISDLLTHSSGLVVEGDAFGKAYEATAGTKEKTAYDLAVKLAAMPLATHPGEAFNYGWFGSNYDVLGAVLEEASGQPLDELFRELIFSPLGMDDTYFWVPEEKRDRYPAIYKLRNGELKLHSRRGDENSPGTFRSGGGGVRSTATDLFRFGQMLLNGGELDGVRLLSPKTVNLMTTDHVGERLPWGGGEFGWGYGVATRERVEAYGIGTVGTFGWEGGTGAQYWVDPVERIVAVLLTPTMPPLHAEAFELFQRSFYAAIDETYVHE